MTMGCFLMTMGVWIHCLDADSFGGQSHSSLGILVKGKYLVIATRTTLILNKSFKSLILQRYSPKLANTLQHAFLLPICVCILSLPGHALTTMPQMCKVQNITFRPSSKLHSGYQVHCRFCKYSCSILRKKYQKN